jgi:regulator of protease activity HflC (stomatin/prohibitin superfamily)
MKILFTVICVAVLIFSMNGCSKVPAGNVGVKVNLLGSDKGIDTEELKPGRYWIGMNEDLFLFPTFAQNQVWTKDTNEGSPNDDSMTFQTVEGLSVNTDIGITYAIDPRKVSEVFQKYRKGVDEITSVYLRNMVRDALVTSASSKPIESVYGAGKAQLIAEVETSVKRQTSEIGIVVERIYWVGELRLPPNVVQSINAKIGATQMAAQRQNEVAQSRSEADKAIEEARGKAESQLAIAKAEALAIKVKGDALRENPELIRLSWIEKWNGQLPVYQLGDSTALIQLPGEASSK